MLAGVLVLAGLALLAGVLVTRRGGHSGPTPGPAPDKLVAVSPGTALADLDRVREQAFREHRPELLQRVYADSRLLAEDTALLERLVPAGCGLVGVHTTFADLISTPDADGDIVVTAKATLAESTLTCSAAPTGPATVVPGDGPAMLQIVLVHRGAGYLILRQQRQS